MTTDYRALCAELIDAHDADEGMSVSRWTANLTAVIDRARAALAAKPVGEGVTDEELNSICDCTPWHGSPRQFGREVARAVLARWGRPAPAPADELLQAYQAGRRDAWLMHGKPVEAAQEPPADGEVGELAVFLRGCADDHYGQGRRQFARAAELLERLASPACVVVKPSPELIEAFKDALTGRIEPLPDDAQVIKPAERTVLVPALQPVSVSERPWEREGWCDETGRCWWGRAADEFCNHDWHYATRAEVDDFCSDAMPQVTLPATALPLPQGEVQ